MNDEIQYIPRKELKPSPLNPRKSFDLGKLEELGVSLRTKGIINPLIVRKLADGTKEIVCGECRWRAAGKGTNFMTGEAIPEIHAMPVLFRELSDLETLEIMLVENMQRNDLTPLEECDAFAGILAEKKDGKPVHTQATLAAKIGKSESVIHSRLMLSKLSKEGRAALASGTLAYRVARRICEAPAALVPKIEDAILNEKKYPIDRWPRRNGDPMTVEDVTKLIEHLSVWITNPPFNVADASLMPQKSHPDTGERIEGGACVGCVYNSATHEQEAKRKGPARCMNAACYKKKVEIHVAAELVKAKEKGETVLKESEAKKVIEPGLFGANQNYVELDKKLGEEERAQGITDKTAPTWRDVVTGKDGKVTVPVVVVVDDSGHVRRFAERKVVAAAADKLGTANKLSLAAGRGKSLDESDRAAQEKKQRAKEIAAQKERMETAFALAEMLVAAVEKKRVPEAASAAMLQLAISHASFDGCKFVCKRRNLDGAKDAYLAVRKYGEKLSAGPQLGLVFELLAAKNLTHCAGPYSSQAMGDDLKPMMKFYGVELAVAKQTAKEKLAAAPKKKDAEKKAEKPAKKSGDEAADARHAAEWNRIEGKLDKAPSKSGAWFRWKDLSGKQQALVAVAMKGMKTSQLEVKEYRFSEDPAAPAKLTDSRDAQGPANAAAAEDAPWRKWDDLTKAERTAVNVHFAAATLDELMKKEYRITADSAGKIKVLEGRVVDKKATAKAAKKKK